MVGSRLYTPSQDASPNLFHKVQHSNKNVKSGHQTQDSGFYVESEEEVNTSLDQFQVAVVVSIISGFGLLLHFYFKRERRLKTNPFPILNYHVHRFILIRSIRI